MLRRTLSAGIIALAFTIPAKAEESCDRVATWLRPGENLIGYANDEARLFMAVLAQATQQGQPPQWADATLVVAYIGDDAGARIHAFGADGCDVGPWTTLPIALLHFIDQHIGTPA